jgi:LacI family transcriptional regulator
MNRVTLKDVADQAGVHTSTASRALNPTTRSVVNQETVERVLDVAERLGYRPHPLARGLRTNQTMTVGMIIPDVENPLFGPIIAGVEERLGIDGYSLLIVNTDPRDESSRPLMNMLVERRVDGLVVASAARNDEGISDLVDQGFPLVLVNRTAEGLPVSSVVGDDDMGIGLAIEHLVGLGHTDIGHIAGPSSLSTGLGRRKAFTRWTKKLGIGHAPVEEAEWFQMGPGKLAAARLLQRHPALTGIVAANDLLALGAYSAAREAGYEVGPGLSITGYNDVPLMEFMQPPLTAVRVPYRQMGFEAADRLLAAMAGDDRLEAIVLEPTLSIRESSAPPRSRG